MTSRRACRRLTPALVALVVLASAALAAAQIPTGTPGDDVLIGTAGDDTLTGHEGNDRLRGGAGDDVLDGGPGSDDLAGGDGIDAAVYPAGRAVSVSIDDLANDGTPGAERDNVQVDVEDVYGGPGADRLVGSAAGNALDAGPGDDRVVGGGGADDLYGGEGDDRFDARDGRPDTVDCGPGEDVAVVDERDSATGCEIVDRRPVVPRVDAVVRSWWVVRGRTTDVVRLEVRELDPPGAQIELRCRGRSCRAARRRITPDAPVTRVAPFLPPRLRDGTRVEVRLTASGHVGKVVRYRMRRGQGPKVASLCLARGASRPRPC